MDLLTGDSKVRTVRKAESRIFPACTVAFVLAILSLLPGRYRLLPAGLDVAIGVVLIATLLAAGASSGSRFWIRLERYAIGAFAALSIAIESIILGRLLIDMATHARNVSGIGLLSTSVGIWLTNVVIFALLYWQIDRGGPQGRAREAAVAADISFPRGEPGEGTQKDWRPTFPDYLFVAFTASTAFSPTDAPPLTVRAKMLLMTQSLISLVTIVAVAARAINLLG